MRARPGEQQPLPPRAGSEQSIETPTGEHITILKAGDPMNAPKIAAEDLGARDGMVRGSAVDDETTPEERDEPAAVVKRYLVLRDANFTDRGHRVRMTKGKIVDSLNYKIPHLLKQGVRLKELEDGDDGSDYLLANELA